MIGTPFVISMGLHDLHFMRGSVTRMLPCGQENGVCSKCYFCGRKKYFVLHVFSV